MLEKNSLKLTWMPAAYVDRPTVGIQAALVAERESPVTARLVDILYNKGVLSKKDVLALLPSGWEETT